MKLLNRIKNKILYTKSKFDKEEIEYTEYGEFNCELIYNNDYIGIDNYIHNSNIIIKYKFSINKDVCNSLFIFIQLLSDNNIKFKLLNEDGILYVQYSIYKLNLLLLNIIKYESNPNIFLNNTKSIIYQLPKDGFDIIINNGIVNEIEFSQTFSPNKQKFKYKKILDINGVDIISFDDPYTFFGDYSINNILMCNIILYISSKYKLSKEDLNLIFNADALYIDDNGNMTISISYLKFCMYIKGETESSIKTELIKIIMSGNEYFKVNNNYNILSILDLTKPKEDINTDLYSEIDEVID